MSSFRFRPAIGLLCALVATMAAVGPLPGAAGEQPTGIERALEVRAAHATDLMARRHVIGTAVGLDGDTPTVVVLAERAPGSLPRSLDGVPVQVRVTGPVTASHHRPGHERGVGPNGGPPEPSAPESVQVGDSTGNANECSAGTVAATVTDGDDVFFLSNNHVLARLNQAELGEAIVSPGNLDAGGCGPSTVVGSLAAYAPLSFGGSNTIDGALALVEPGVEWSNTAPSYGTVATTPMDPVIGLKVEKHGRTSGHTRGTITMVGATIDVGYGPAGTVRFVNQVIVEDRRPFLRSGDSGSLLVRRGGAEPVGLLFASNVNGTLAVANPIDAVFSLFGVRMPSAPTGTG